MDVLTLPEPGWALAYPDPGRNTAHLLHTRCGWRSAATESPEWWPHLLMQARHDCTPIPSFRYCREVWS